MMKKSFVLFVFLLSTVVFLKSQNPVFEKYFYTSTNRDEGFTLVEKPDGNFWSVSHSQSAVPSSPCGVSMAIIPMDSRGNPSTCFKLQAGSYTRFFDGLYTSDGNILLVGEPMCLFKADTSGNVLWSKFYRMDVITGYDLNGYCVTESGGNYFHAYQHKSTAGRSVLIKSDPAGNTLWFRSMGSIIEEFLIEDMIPDDSGGVFVVSKLGHGSGNYIQVARIASDSTVLFAKEYYINSTYAHVAGIARNAIGDIVIGVSDNTIHTDFAVDINGDLKWATRVTVLGTYSKYLKSIAAVDNGNVAFVGRYGSLQYEQAFIYTLDTDGNYQWGKSYGTLGKSENCFNEVLGTNDCGFMLGGRAEDSLSYYVNWVMQIDANGNCSYPGDSLGVNLTYSYPLSATSSYVPDVPDSLKDAGLVHAKVTSPVTVHDKTSGFSSAPCISVGTEPAESKEVFSLSPNPYHNIACCGTALET
jgi:hypothetical protein